MVLLVLAGCSKKSSDTGTPSRLTIAVSIPPQKYFVEKICGDLATVKVLIPPGASPHTFEPKPSQMAELSDASLYFAIGVEVEDVWLKRLASVCPNLRIIATDSGIVKIGGKCEHHEEGDHADHAGHSGSDPHIWLAPSLVKKQVRTIAAALCEIDTVHRNVYSERLAVFEAEIDTLAAHVKATLGRCEKGMPFLVFHPSWAYFAQEFSLTQIAIESEGKEPGMREIGIIAEKAKQIGASTIFVQPQFSKKLAETIARELGGTTAVADPLAENWDENMRLVAESICNDK